MSEVTAVPLRPVARGGVAALWISIAILLVVGVCAAWATTRSAVMLAMSPADYLAANARRHGVKTTASGLQYQVLKPGKGATPGPGDVALVEYRGTLTSGVQFDATKPGQPVAMPVGQVVPGFSEALQLMPRGAEYRVWIPPQLAYGDQEAGPIPANSVLVFDITMHAFMPMPQGQAGAMPPGM